MGGIIASLPLIQTLAMSPFVPMQETAGPAIAATVAMVIVVASWGYASAAFAAARTALGGGH